MNLNKITFEAKTKQSANDAYEAWRSEHPLADITNIREYEKYKEMRINKMGMNVYIIEVELK